MRTLLISGSYFPPQVGGISTVMGEVCAGLGERRVAVLTGVSGDLLDTRLKRIRIYRAADCFPPRTARQTLTIGVALARALAFERPGLLQFASLEDAWLAYWTHRAFGLRHMFYVHGNEVMDVVKSDWAKPKLALRAASAVIAVSRYTGALVQRLGVSADRIRVVHPGCDLVRLRRVPVDEDTRSRLTRGRPRARVLLTVGNIVERKGHDVVIRALSRLRPSAAEVIYVIAGDGPGRARLEQLAAEAGVANRVVFLGRVPPQDLPLLYSMADIFLMVSRERLEHADFEGFGIVFVEAAACGAPVIGGNSGGVEDAVVDGVTGLLVDPNSESQVVAAITRLLTDAEFARRLGAAGAQRAAREFSWEHYGRQIGDILEEIDRSHR